MARRARPAPPPRTARRSASEEIAGAREKLGWRHKPFDVPKPILAGWRAAGARHRAAYDAWAQAAKRLDAAARAGLTDPIDDKVRARDRGRDRRAQGGLQPRGRQACDAAILAESAGEAPADYPRPDRRLGRPHRLRWHPDQAARDHQARRLRRQLHPLRRARARHGGGDERHGAAWRHRAVWRHIPRVHRLLPPVDPAVGADAAARDLCDDPRFDRSGRGRPDPSADRASGGAARHAQSQRHAPGRFGRMRRVLGAGAARQADAHHPGADPPGRAAAPHYGFPNKICRPRAPMC